MKRSAAIIGIFIFLTTAASAESPKKGDLSFGVLFMAGGRYDNLRMCVGSAAGVKGGPIADIMLVTKYSLSSKYSLTFNLPVMRPILFGVRFDMLQFEPEFTLEFRKKWNERRAFITGPGLGVSLHYGPDYKSDLDNRGESFFAAGPFISWKFGLAFLRNEKTRSMLGLKLFYVPLFAKDRANGTVLGGALTYILFL
ncbi:MAG: hypothetical protein JXB26_16885 [Candidatus Aminicenantes bacterium]|nr:hypothetical protein [Candidatus Aminicenantes bacterium]